MLHTASPTGLGLACHASSVLSNIVVWNVNGSLGNRVDSTAVRSLINVLSGRKTGFHRQENIFNLNSP